MDTTAFLRDTILQHIPNKREPTPLILFDECVNNPQVINTAHTAIKSNLAIASRCAWSQLRQKSDGSFIHVEGYRRGLLLPDGEEWGMPVKGWSFSDTQIVDSIVASFIMADRVIFLSENTRNNQDGIRIQPEERVKPALIQYNHGRLGLLTLMKKGETKWDTYAQELLETLKKRSIGIGYEYKLI